MNRELVEAGELRIWLDADYWRVLDRMESHDRALVDVCIDPDMPGQTAVYAFALARPDFKLAFEACWERRSFPVQARAERLGKRFMTEAAELRHSGMTNREIGRKLGVHWVTAAKYLSGVPIPEKTHCLRGHPYPANGPKRCEICSTALRRIRRGELSRSESAKVQITVACSFCGEPVTRSRVRGKNRKARCRECRRAYFENYGRNRRQRGNIDQSPAQGAP